MFMGVDPGCSGGITVVDDFGKIVAIRKMPETLTEMEELFIELSWEYTIDYCCVELVHSLPFDSPKTAFALGKNYGRLETLLTVFKVPHETVSPQKWQKHFNMKRSKDEGDTKWKNRLRDLATRLYGATTKDIILQVADSALIARYCFDNRGRKEGLAML